jgi:hypothetical protein
MKKLITFINLENLIFLYFLLFIELELMNYLSISLEIERWKVE